MRKIILCLLFIDSINKQVKHVLSLQGCCLVILRVKFVCLFYDKGLMESICINADAFSFYDTDRIQTYGLLIRSRKWSLISGFFFFSHLQFHWSIMVPIVSWSYSPPRDNISMRTAPRLTIHAYSVAANKYAVKSLYLVYMLVLFRLFLHSNKIFGNFSYKTLKIYLSN